MRVRSYVTIQASGTALMKLLNNTYIIYATVRFFATSKTLTTTPRKCQRSMNLAARSMTAVPQKARVTLVNLGLRVLRIYPTSRFLAAQEQQGQTMKQ